MKLWLLSQTDSI